MIARWRGPRLWIVAAIALTAMAAGVLTAVQLRAAHAQEQRDAVAEEAEAAAQAEAAAEAAAEIAAARQALLDAWGDATAAADVASAEAASLLDESEGQVPDDAVRVALGAALAEVAETLEITGTEPTATELSALQDALAALEAAVEPVRLAHAAWVEEQAALEAAAPPAPPAPQASTWVPGGAAQDCGGPESFEPPSGSGPVFYTSTPSESGDGSNGRIPRSQMAALSWCVDSQGNAQWLRTDAAAALTQLNDAFRARFGENIAVDMSYRSYEDQVAMREAYGSIAAQPGTSNHGLGTAFDTWEWRAYSFGSARYDWLVANGPAYGWVAPGWARQNGSNPEYWHFEYTG